MNEKQYERDLDAVVRTMFAQVPPGHPIYALAAITMIGLMLPWLPLAAILSYPKR